MKGRGSSAFRLEGGLNTEASAGILQCLEAPLGGRALSISRCFRPRNQPQMRLRNLIFPNGSELQGQQSSSCPERNEVRPQTAGGDDAGTGPGTTSVLLGLTPLGHGWSLQGLPALRSHSEAQASC